MPSGNAAVHPHRGWQPGDDGPDLVKLMLATVWERPSGDKIVLVTIDTLPDEVPDVQNMITSIYESAH